MSGFLRRMIAGAASPERRLRPFAGSVFSQASDHQVPGDLQMTEEVVVASAETADENVPRRSRPAVAEPAAQFGRATEAARLPLAAQSVTPATRMQPASQMHAVAEVAAPRAQAPAEPRIAAPSHGQESAPEEVTAQSLPREKSTPSSQSYELLVPGHTPAQGEAAAQKDAALAQAATSTAPAKTAWQNSRGPQQVTRQSVQPPDVQVHIGRIEVVAVPPPAQQAAPSSRKSTTLDDYLRQVGGRR
jgi:hypothetical protein